MLKKFFISLLGTVAGIWIFIILAVIMGIFSLGALLGSESVSGVVEKHSVLLLKLAGDIQERNQPQSFLAMVQNLENNDETLDNMLASVRRAANDSKIDGLFIDARGAAMGFASREELIQAIDDFKASGKWIYAYADNYAQGDYLLASAADKVFLNPVGSVDIRGIGVQTPFFKALLDKLGVKVQVVKVGTYKSAVEPFILDDMSEAARLQTKVFVDSIWNFYASYIAHNRKVTPGRVSQWADSLTFTWGAVQDCDAGIVTETAYRRQVEDMLRDLTDIDEDDDIRFVTPSQYVDFYKNEAASDKKDHVAVLYAFGDIVDSGDEGIVGEKMVRQIIDLADDDKVKALLLRVNSGGGSAFASEQIWEALEYFKSKGKPFYVSMGDYAASGGYYISCGADRIFADAMTLTGSIGVFGMIPDFKGLVTDKLGVTFSEVSSSPNASFMSLMKPMTPFQLDAMQKYVEDTYDVFTSRVAEGRHMSVDSVKAIAEGRVWIGGSAVALGLVDQIGTLHDAVTSLTAKVGLDPDDTVAYPEIEADFMQQFLKEKAALESSGGFTIDRQAVQYLMTVKRLREAAPVQARMPFFEIR